MLAFTADTNRKLKSRLMDPALPALYTFIQLTTTFHQTTHLNDMSIEMTISVLATIP